MYITLTLPSNARLTGFKSLRCLYTTDKIQQDFGHIDHKGCFINNISGNKPTFLFIDQPPLTLVPRSE